MDWASWRMTGWLPRRTPSTQSGMNVAFKKRPLVIRSAQGRKAAGLDRAACIPLGADYDSTNKYVYLFLSARPQDLVDYIFFFFFLVNFGKFGAEG